MLGRLPPASEMQIALLSRACRNPFHFQSQPLGRRAKFYLLFVTNTLFISNLLCQKTIKNISDLITDIIFSPTGNGRADDV
jgi:hypothetical protein